MFDPASRSFPNVRVHLQRQPSLTFHSGYRAIHHHIQPDLQLRERSDMSAQMYQRDPRAVRPVVNERESWEGRL